ncbi:MAG: DEAD/DEAH box helicase, partial [Halobacteriaceae archaeon]
SCGSRTMDVQEFDVAIVDEASQLTEPDTLAAITLADRFVLVGDHEQLPPVVQNQDLGTSLFERLIESFPEASEMLDRQYRMSQRIQAYPSRRFYDGNLRPASDAVARQRVTDLNADGLSDELAEPVTFHDVQGDSGTQTDREEAERVAMIVEEYLSAGISPSDIGVIAPFRAQVSEITRRV